MSRSAVYHDFIAEQANLGVALDIDGFVFAQFGFGGDEQGAVIYVRTGGVAGEEDEIGVAVALGVDVHALADALVEVQFDHAAGPGFEQEETEGTEILISTSVSSVCSC